jgi:His/Glu/Gln/Arg/opine family amino acid ABC transporter permease subunit
MYDLDWNAVWRYRFEFVGGLALGLKMAVIGLAIATVIGLLVAFARISRHRWLSLPAAAYVEFIRNIPLLLIIFIFYFGFPMWAMKSLPRGLSNILILDAESSAIASLAIYGGAYLAEVFRAGILGVSRRFVEAGRSLGLSGFEVARYVTLPIMFRTVLAEQYVHLALQGHLAGDVDIRAGADLHRPQDEHRYVQDDRGLDGGGRALPRHRVRHCDCAPLPGAAHPLVSLKEREQCMRSLPIFRCSGRA